MKKRGFLIIVFLAGLLLAENGVGKVQAEQDLTKVKNMNLNSRQEDGSYRIAGITDPTPAPDDWDISYSWEGSRVYFGSYGGNPILFRVLDADTTKYNADHTILLDCDRMLEKIKFYPRDYWNDWDGSYLKAWMNSNEKDGFVNSEERKIPGMLSSFTKQEQDVIALSTKKSEEGTDGYGWPLYLDWCPLFEDKVFALDAKEASYPPYGYSSTNSHAENRIKDNTKGICWWLRSDDYEDVDHYCVGVVDWDGRIRHSRAAGMVCWACPALNLELSKVFMVSSCKMDKALPLAEVGSNDVAADTWKFTLLDTGKTAAITKGKHIKNKKGVIIVPFTYTGTDISQISVMITDKAYDSENAVILYYGRLNTKKSFEGARGKGKGTFNLPDNLPETAKIYILAEDVNDANYTDFASAPVLIEVNEKREK